MSTENVGCKHDSSHFAHHSFTPSIVNISFYLPHLDSCTSCVERELSRRKEFQCPICDTIVKRVTLSTRTLDDVQCEKDTSWRRRVTKVFNKVESDFESLEEYNNYLEQVEDISKYWRNHDCPSTSIKCGYSLFFLHIQSLV